MSNNEFFCLRRGKITQNRHFSLQRKLNTTLEDEDIFELMAQKVPTAQSSRVETEITLEKADIGL